jgi:hypothetical protein
MILILLLIIIVIGYTHPWIDVYTDYRGVRHITLWYSNYRGERKFINLIGGQE